MRHENSRSVTTVLVKVKSHYVQYLNYIFIVSVNQKASAKNLPCLFADLVEKYSDIGLKPCETKKWQRWRHANTAEIARRLEFYHNHFPELINLHSSLELYSFCEKHYNQIVATNQFINVL